MQKTNAAGAGVERDMRLPRSLQWLATRWFLLRRALLMGVRGVVLDGDGQVLLVRHSYTRGWHFPGGGVEVGETIEEALRKELREEAGVTIGSTPTLHGVFHNSPLAGRDHVAVFVVRDFTRDPAALLSREIREARFFPVDELPADASRATRERLAEILDGRPISAAW